MRSVCGHVVTLVLACLVLTPVAVYGQSQTLTAYWDPNPPADQVTDYEVCLGTSSLSCNVGQTVVPSNQVSYTFSPNPGVLYYFAVRAINSAGPGLYSSEVRVSIPNLAQPVNQNSAVNVPINPLNLSASDPDGGTIQFSQTGLPLGLSFNPSTGQISGTPTATGTYNVTVSASDGLLAVFKSFTWTIGDTVAPALAITSHTSGQTVTSANVTISGTATDNGAGGSGIASVTVNGQAASGGAATGNGVANWSRSLTLSAGVNVITVIATDGARNARTIQITLNLSAPSDTTAPTLAITSHSSGQTVSSTSVTISGTATDNGTGGSGIVSVTVNGQAAVGGTASGNATANWSRSITLVTGTNVVTVIAIDGANNARTSQITLLMSPPAPAPAPLPSNGARDTFAGVSGTMLSSHVPDVSPGTMWVQRQGGAWLQNGWAASGSSSGYTIATLETNASDGSVAADVLSNSATPFGGVVFRAVDTSRMLVLRYVGNANIGLLGLFRRVNGDFLLIQQVTVAPIQPNTIHRLEARLAGSRVQAVWDGAVVFEQTVMDYQTATQHGLLWHAEDPLARFDNFTAVGGGGASSPNGAPVITGPANQTNVTGATVSVAITATDPEGGALQYGATGLPSGVSVNALTGLISGTLAATAGTYSVTVSASDGTSTTTRGFTWTVTTPTPAPAPPPSGTVARDTFAGVSGTMLSSHVPDASPGTMWVQRQGGAWLQNGWVASVSSFGYTIATLETNASDGSVAADVLSNSATPFGGVVFRAVDTSRMLVLRYVGNANIGLLGLFRRVNGDFLLIQQVTVAPIRPNTIHRLEARLAGSRVQAVWDGAVVFEQTVTDYQTATQHGLLWHAEDPLAWFDNFTVNR